MTLAGGHPPGSGPDDVELGRLLAEGLHRQSGGPVDGDRLLAGARRGAARIRRRRQAALGAAAVVVLALLPVGVLRGGLFGQQSETTAGSASRALAPESASPADLADGSAPAAATPSAYGALTGSDSAAGPTVGGALPSGKVAPPEGIVPPTTSRELAGTSSSSASGAVTGIPTTALLTGADVTQVVLDQTTDRAPAPAVPAADSCGRTASGSPTAVASRSVTFERRQGAAGSWWLLGDTVRVFSGSGAGQYLAGAATLGCSGLALSGIGDAAVGGHGAADAQGRTHWYVVVRVGVAVSEVRFVVPRGSGVTADDARRLVGIAADRLTASGLG
jgi:hypothetical protein